MLLFWERQSMRRMIFMNLKAHRHRNKMTSIIYSISLGFLIFLVVAYNLELQVLQLTELLSVNSGSYWLMSTWYVSRTKHTPVNPEILDPVLLKHAHNIRSFSFSVI